MTYQSIAVRDASGGFALIAVLIAQLIIGVAALTVMQTSGMSESQAGAARHGQSAYQGAEQDLVTGVRCLRAAAGESLEPDVAATECATSTREMKPMGAQDVLITTEAETQSGARRQVSAIARLPVPLRDADFKADSAYTCYGAECDFEAAPGNADHAADGTDRQFPELENGCDTQGSRTPEVSEDGTNKPGLTIPDGQHTDKGGGGGNGKGGGGGGGRGSSYEGDPPVIDSRTDYEDQFDRTVDEGREALERRIDRLAEDGERGGGEVGDKETGVWVVGEGETLSLEGGASSFGGVIILDGGTLELGGNECFAGLVASRDGGQIDASGTPAIVGAALSISAFGGETALSGNASFFYSSETLEWARDIFDENTDHDQVVVTDFDQP